jgi:DNA-directed RNA polymerase alpha subunit
MEDRKVTRDTLIDHLEITVRLHRCLVNEKKHFWLRADPATVGDFIDMPDHELMRIPNFGRKTLHEWREVTAHLRGDDAPHNEEHLAEVKLLREITSQIRMIGANHKATGTLYSKLADTLENIK